MREAMSERVLVVDDHPLTRDALAALLVQGGFEVVGEAADGEEALELAERLQPELVLLDLSMPGMDGLEALPLVRSAAPAAAVIVFSGFAADRMREPALALGAARYLEKGEPLSAVRAAVREVA